MLSMPSGRRAMIPASREPGAPIVTQPDLLLKPVAVVAVSVRRFLVPVAVAFGRATRHTEARAILTNGERTLSISG